MSSTSDSTSTPRQVSVVEALIPIASLIVLVSISFYLFGDEGALGPNQIALVFATMTAVFIGWRVGYSLDELQEAAVASVSSGIGAMFILLAVGSLIGTWAMSGTLIAMVYYGLNVLHPNYFYVTAALICAVVSLGIGSSWTVVGTIGIGLMGIAANMGLSPAITAGAIISGAYFGDKSSPLSDTVNLAAAVTGANLYTHIKNVMVWTSLPAMAIAVATFWWLGSPGDFDASAKIAAIEGFFHISLWLFVPLLLVVLLAILRLPPFTTIFLGAVAGGVLAVVVAPERVIAYAGDPELPRSLALLKGAWLALADGYRSSTGDAAIDRLVSRGGMSSMLGTIWLIITALAFGGVVEKAGMLERLMAPVIEAAKTTGRLVLYLVTSTIATNVVTADQYMAVVLPGRMFKKAFADRGYVPQVLSRAIGDSATVTSALIPWNSCGAYMAATLGVATLAYAPYTLFNVLCPIITVATAYAGIGLTTVDETEKR